MFVGRVFEHVILLSLPSPPAADTQGCVLLLHSPPDQDVQHWRAKALPIKHIIGKGSGPLPQSEHLQ